MKTDENDHEQEENRMDNIIFAKYDMDSGFIQAWTEDCNLILIDCDAVEKAIADNMYQRSQLDYLIYNDPIGYAKLVWEECPEEYLKTATDYTKLSDLRWFVSPRQTWMT